MYLSFYKLKQKPFQISTDPKFLWLGERHEEALATLRYGVQDNKGFLLLTGDVGTGKTTLINALLSTLGEDTIVASIRDPAFDPMDFLHYTAHAFGMEVNFTNTKAAFLIQFERFLYDANKKNKRVLLIIDEAQRMSQSLLEEVRLLSNIEKQDSKLLNIFFVGQLEFNDILLRPENKAIRQRITINYNITPLTEQETGRYIKHRLEVAGAEEEILSFEALQDNEKGVYTKDGLKPPDDLNETFTHEAALEIYSFSKGYPRLINIICDRCLLTGFVEGSPTITLRHVRECAKELIIPQSEQNRTTEPKVSGEVSNEVTADVSGEHENNVAVPPQKSVSENEIPEDRINGNKHSNARNMIIGVGLLLLFILIYISLSKNGSYPLQGQGFVESTQNFLRQTVKVMETKEPDTGNQTESFQRDPVLEDNKTSRNQKDKKVNKTPRRDEASAPDKKNVQNSNESAVVNSGSQKQIKGVETLKSKSQINTKMAIVAGNIESGSPEPTDIIEKANIAPPAEIVTNENELAAAQEIQITSLVTFEKLVIPFPSNSNLPSPRSLEKLNLLAAALLTRPSYKIMVTGFTDSVGNEEFNEKLSEFRANNIKSYLVGKGVKESRIATRGLGSQQPIASNDTPTGRTANRRVEVEIAR